MEEPVTNRRISVVICTLGRALGGLSDCLQSVRQQSVQGAEVVVVSTRGIPGYLGRLANRIIVDPRRGLSYARNVGVLNSSGEIIGFTDDDCTCSETWIENLMGAFSDPRVWMVTGRSLPKSSEGQFVSAVRKNSLLAVYKLSGDRVARTRSGLSDSISPMEPWKIGSGNNMAIRRTAFEFLGGFDEELGLGSSCGSAEDTDVFLRTLLYGGAITYNPLALIYHEKLNYHDWYKRQFYTYRKGEGALLKKFSSAPFSPRTRRVFAGRNLRLLFDLVQSVAELKIRVASQQASSIVSLNAGFAGYRKNAKVS